MLLTRETNLETPQIFIKKWPQGPQGESSERLLTHFPHPHPSIKDLQKEVIRSATLPKTKLTIALDNSVAQTRLAWRQLAVAALEAGTNWLAVAALKADTN